MSVQIKERFLPYLPFLVLISFISLLNILARVIFSPLTPFICFEMDLCHKDTGNLFLVLSFGFAITLFMSQFLSSRFSHRFTIIVSVLISGFSLMIISYIEHLPSFKALLFFVGLSTGLFVPSAVSLIREHVPSYHLGKAFGIFATSQSFAFVLAPLITEHFIAFYSWKDILYGLGLFSSSLSLIFIFLIPQKENKSFPITLNFVRNIFSWPSFWILMVLLCVINGLNVGIYNMAPDYFEKHNLIEAHEVNYLIIIARTVSIITAILGGVFTDRFGLKRSLVLILILCGGITVFMGMTHPMFALLLFSVQSPIAACLKPIIHFGMASIVPPEKNAAVVSIMAPFGFFFGAGVVPQLLGIFGDFNLYSQGFVFFGLTALVSGVLFGLSGIYKHIRVSQLKSMEF